MLAHESGARRTPERVVMDRIVVIGGGIGGLAAALALQEFGFEVEVYEQEERGSELVAGTWVPPNAMRILGRLGRAEAVREVGVPIERIRVERRNGRAIRQVEFGAIRRRTGFGNTSVRRSTLRRLLREELAEGTVRFGRACRQVEREGDEVRVVFEDGSSRGADLLVGADGIESHVRGDIFGMVRLRYGGQIRFLGLADRAFPGDERGVTREIWGGKHRFGYWGVDGGRTFWFAAIAEPNPEAVDWGRERLRSAYDEFSGKGGELMEATPSEHLERTEPRDVRPLETWSAGRVLLVGDAAHAPLPNLGQGAAQAIEDGWALAASLDRWESVAEAFERFEAARVARANRVIRQSRFLGRIAHLDSPVAAGARDWLLEVVPDAIERLEAEWLYDVDQLVGMAG